MIGWIIGGRVHHKPIAMKVTHLSVISTFGDLTLEFLQQRKVKLD